MKKPKAWVKSAIPTTILIPKTPIPKAGTVTTSDKPQTKFTVEEAAWIVPRCGSSPVFRAAAQRPSTNCGLHPVHDGIYTYEMSL